MFNDFSGHDNRSQDFQNNDPFGFANSSWGRFGMGSSREDSANNTYQQHNTAPQQPFRDAHATQPQFDSSSGMDWAPTQSFDQHSFHHGLHQAGDNGAGGSMGSNVGLDTMSPVQGPSGVGRLVAQFENKGYNPPLPPRPINQASQPRSHVQVGSPSMSQFGSLDAVATSVGTRVTSPVHHSPADSYFGSFGAQPRVMSPVGHSPQPVNYGSFHDNSRMASPMPAGSMPGPFGGLDDFMSHDRLQSPLIPSPMTMNTMGPTSIPQSPGLQSPMGASGTPGFEMWKPPAATPKPQVSQQPRQSRTTNSAGFAKPPVPPKPAMSAGSQFVLELNPIDKAKGKAPAKPPRPRAPAATSSSLSSASALPAPEPTPSQLLADETMGISSSPPPFSQTPVTEQPPLPPRTQPLVRPTREQVPAEAWEQYRTTIKTLYLEERRPLKEVMSIMAEKYGFQATPKMYKTRFSQWGFVKNNTEDEVKRLLSMKFQRDAEGKVSEFVRNGKVVNLGTYLKRKGVTEYDLVDFDLTADLPSHIRCRTPTPPPIPGYLQSPDLLRAQELIVGNMRKAFLHCRQIEVETDVQIGWPMIMVWGASSSDLLVEANFYFEARDVDQGGQLLMRAFGQLESDLKKLNPQGIKELLLGMVHRDPGVMTALCKYLAAYSSQNFDRSHPLRQIFTSLYEVQQKHGPGTLSDLLWGTIPTVAEELEAIYGRRHPYVARTWIDLAMFYNYANQEKLEKLVVELRAVLRQVEQRFGSSSADTMALRYAILQLLWSAAPDSDQTKRAANELWSEFRKLNLVFPVRDNRPNVWCYHSPLKVDPWTKRCRRRYDSGMAILEKHVGVKVMPYFEEDFHTTQHELEAQDSWAAAMGQMQSSKWSLF